MKDCLRGLSDNREDREDNKGNRMLTGSVGDVYLSFI